MATPRYRLVPKRSRSLGPDIVRFGVEHGVELDEWQADALDVFSGIHGRKRQFVSPTNVLCVPRQNGKSWLLVLRALFGLFVLRKRVILFSSHMWATTNETFRVMKDVIEANDDLVAEVKATRLSAAQLGFELHDGARILFLTRSRASARGFSGDEIYIDEAHFLSEPSHAALRPTLGGRSAQGTAQVFYAFSAVDQMRHPDGAVASRLRKRGIEGAEGLAFVEFSAKVTNEDGRELLPVEVPPAACLDVDLLEAANPAVPHRLSIEFLLDEARTLDVASMACEHMGIGDWHDEDALGQSQIDLAKFLELVDVDARPLVPFKVGFDVSRDRRRGATAIAGRENGHVVVRLDQAHPGVDWIAPRIAEIGGADAPNDLWSSSDGIVCDSFQAPLAERVQIETGLDLQLLDRPRVAQACAKFVDYVNSGVLRHDGNPLLIDALRGATTVSVGDAGWAFARRTSSADISPLYAAVFALAGVDEDDDGGPFIF